MDGAVLAAIIGVGPATLMGVATWRNSVTAKREAAAAHVIVKGNGKGDVSQMVAKLLNASASMMEWQERHAIQDDIQFRELHDAVKTLSTRREDVADYKHIKEGVTPQEGRPLDGEAASSPRSYPLRDTGHAS